MGFEPAPGIYGGPKSLEAYLAYMGVGSLEELEDEQLSLWEDLRYEQGSRPLRRARRGRRVRAGSRRPMKPAASGRQ
jgi:hypothetical protein